MKNAIILHGTGDSPKSFWFPWLKNELENDGYQVWTPQLPDADNPQIKKWLPFILENAKIDKDTVIVGHSAGATVILALLEAIDIQIKQAISVAGYCYNDEDPNDPIIKKEYNWDKISKNTQELFLLIQIMTHGVATMFKAEECSTKLGESKSS
ncbi:alpha/beta hydrolase [Candidatus Dojkabacteria bacterium]|nr:alpha/beta hydrolase [Candidatus Dojkabacteria bacterium]